MMLRRILTFLLLAGLFTCGAQATTFKIATLAPDGSSWMKEMRQGADEIDKATAGRVQFRFYPGGIMGNDSSVLRKIRIGQLQGGAVSGGGLANIYPESQVYTIPFLFRDYAEVDYVRQRVDPLLIDGLRDKGFISFGFSEGGFAYLLTQNPVGGIDDLNGHKVWVPEGDEISRAAFEASKISPVSLPLTDVLTGLQTGLIDTVAGSAMGAIALQWHTRIKYLTNAPLMYLYGGLVVQRKAFEKLSEADRQTTTRIMSEVFARLNTKNREDDISAHQALKNQGIEFITPTKEETARWQAAVDTAMGKLLSKGNLFDPQMLQTVQQQLQSYRGETTAQ